LDQRNGIHNPWTLASITKVYHNHIWKNSWNGGKSQVGYSDFPVDFNSYGRGRNCNYLPDLQVMGNSP